MSVREEVLSRVKLWRPYVEAKLGFRNHWYPALPAADIAENVPRSIKLLGETLLINRIDGKLFCIRDRCLHRGVRFSDGPFKCFSHDTISCWYHGWTYTWETGELCAVLTNPESAHIGRHRLKTYLVVEAKGLAFVFLGDIAPPPLAHDVPPNFLDDDLEIGLKVRSVKSNWRVGAENGFDSGHIFIHRDSPLIKATDMGIPLGMAPAKGVGSTRTAETDDGPQGVYDLLKERSKPVFEAFIDGNKVAQGNYGSKGHAEEISIWLPGVLKVDPWPQRGMTQFEWYVPIDEGNHYYFQALGCRVASEAERDAYRRDFREKWSTLALEAFNNDDIMARESSEDFYKDDFGWIDEHLGETDAAIVEWRKFASTHNRGIQTPELARR